MSSDRDFFQRFTHVAGESRSYLNLLYFILMLPLGIVYFTLVVTGISLSFGLLILFIGIFIALGLILFVRLISGLHQMFAGALLDFELPPKQEIPKSESNGIFDKLKQTLTDGKTYTSFIYMILSLPLGVIYFTLTITLLSVSISFTLSPLFWILEEETEIFLGNDWVWYLDFEETILLMIAGVVLFFATLHLGNLLARVEKFLCQNLLARFN